MERPDFLSSGVDHIGSCFEREMMAPAAIATAQEVEMEAEVEVDVDVDVDVQVQVALTSGEHTRQSGGAAKRLGGQKTNAGAVGAEGRACRTPARRFAPPHPATVRRLRV